LEGFGLFFGRVASGCWTCVRDRRLLSVKTLIAYADEFDNRFFSRALEGHETLTLAGAPTERFEGVEALSVVHGKLTDATTLDLLPTLRLVVTRSTGYDHIDMAAVRKRGIAVCNVPDYGSTTIAEFTLGLILSLSRHIPQAAAQCRVGRFSVEGLMGADLEGKTLGIVGFGKIGRNVARMAEGFAMKLVFYDPYAEGSVSLGDLLAQSDFVALCCLLTSETHHLMDASAFARMKPGACLINTARGAIVDSEALLAALNAGKLRGAALDVLEDEESIGPVSQALIEHSNVLVTPHLAFDSQEALNRIRESTAITLRSFADGKIVNSVFTG
jgi:D-lactate dehydrogenase